MKGRTAIYSIIVATSSLYMSPAFAQSEDISWTHPSKQQIRLLYDFYAGIPVDFEQIARNTDSFRRASEFDRQTVLKQETDRIKSEFSRFPDVKSINLRVSGIFSEYDSNLGGFNFDIFQDNIHIPFDQVSLVFDNASEFGTWKLDVPQAREMLSRLGNSRQIVYEIQTRPFAASTSRNGELRTQVRQVRILDASGRVVLADLKSSQPPRASAAPGVASISAVAPDKMNVLGLALGQSHADFSAWAAKNGFKIDKPFLASTSYVSTFNFAASDDAMAELKKTSDRNNAAFRLGASSLFNDTSGAPKPPLEVFGPTLNCLTNNVSNQVCGQVAFGPGKDPAERKIVSIVLSQGVATTSAQSLSNALVEKFGAYTDQFPVLFGTISGRQYVWGGSFAEDSAKNGSPTLGQQKRRWPVEAFIFQPEANRGSLIVQINGNPDSATNNAGQTAPARPRL